MLNRFSTWIADHWKWVLLAWMLSALVLRLAAPRWSEVIDDSNTAYFPAEMPTAQGEKLRAEAFPGQQGRSQIAIVLARQDRALDDADLLIAEDVAARFEAQLEQLRLLDVWTHNDEVVGDKLHSRDRRAVLVLLQLPTEFMETENIRILRGVNATLDEVRAAGVPQGLEIGVTGSAAIGGDMLMASAESIQNTELTTVILVVLILAAVYRAPLLILIPMITIGVSIVVSTNLVALLTQLNQLPGFNWWNFRIFTMTRIFIVVILFGSGTDFCLFLIARFKEELQAGTDRSVAIARSLAGVTAALIGSAMTTVLGLGMMFFADFGKFSNAGPAIAICLFVTLLASLTLAPALMRGCGRFVFWPWGIEAFSGERSERPEGARRMSIEAVFNQFWEGASWAIVRHPGAILATTVILLAPAAIEGSSLRVTYDLLSELEPGRGSRQGTALLLSHYPPGETGPVMVLAHLPGAALHTREGKDQIADLSVTLSEIPGVQSVRSLSRPLGDPEPVGLGGLLRRGGGKRLAASETSQAKAIYLSQVPEYQGAVARFDLVLKEEPFSLEAIELLNSIDERFGQIAADPYSDWHGAKFHLLGTTASTRDLRTVTSSDQTRIQQLVVLAVLAVLLVLIRRPLVSLYLILSVLFSYYVTLGITEWVFSWSYGATYHGLDWKVPLFLFVILIAVGQDYNIYLITRVIEEQRRHGPLAGLRVAVARTGGIITSCGVIMAGTFISMMSGTLRGVRELGFALSLGILLDTLVVRPVLVPAFLALLERLKSTRDRRDHPEKSREADPEPVASGH